jgi:hypothetical protein
MASQRQPAASEEAGGYDMAAARSPQAAATAAPTYDLGQAEPSAPAYDMAGGDVCIDRLWGVGLKLDDSVG